MKMVAVNDSTTLYCSDPHPSDGRVVLVCVQDPSSKVIIHGSPINKQEEQPLDLSLNQGIHCSKFSPHTNTNPKNNLHNSNNNNLTILDRIQRLERNRLAAASNKNRNKVNNSGSTDDVKSIILQKLLDRREILISQEKKLSNQIIRMRKLILNYKKDEQSENESFNAQQRDETFKRNRSSSLNSSSDESGNEEEETSSYFTSGGSTIDSNDVCITDDLDGSFYPDRKLIMKRYQNRLASKKLREKKRAARNEMEKMLKGLELQNKKLRQEYEKLNLRIGLLKKAMTSDN